jgi:hypothetical protein
MNEFYTPTVRVFDMSNKIYALNESGHSIVEMIACIYKV